LQEGSLDYCQKIEKICQKYGIESENDQKWLDIIENLEYLDKSHQKLFMNYLGGAPYPKNSEAFAYLERFLAYFVYRHCTEAADSDDFCARLSFCLFCERLLKSLISALGDDSFENVVKLASIISDEIEYCDDNTWDLTYPC
jgi:hypothetical protein